MVCLVLNPIFVQCVLSITTFLQMYTVLIAKHCFQSVVHNCCLPEGRNSQSTVTLLPPFLWEPVFHGIRNSGISMQPSFFLNMSVY